MSLPALVTISSTGISGLTYAEVLAALTTEYQSIFGSDVYLGNDSQDGQFIAITSQAISDAISATIAAYNAFSPSTAQGAGLSSNVKINGLARLAAAASTALVTISGASGTVITNGQVGDANGYTWNLPATVAIPGSSSIVVTATCTTLGAIAAAASSITKILTPVLGWQGVTNAASATLGTNVETDAALRVRQAASVALPSQTVFDGVLGAVEAVAGVTRAMGYENNTNATNGNGVPAHNLAFIVEGGAQADIVNAIGSKIAPGVPSYGTTSATYTSPSGSSKSVSYSVATETTISVALTVKQLAGWSSEIETAIQNAIIAYITALPIGGVVSYLGLMEPALAALAQYPGAYRVNAMTVNSGTADIALAWNAAATTAAADVTFTLV